VCRKIRLSNGKDLFYAANYDFKANKVIEPTWVYHQYLNSSEKVPIARPVTPNWIAPKLNRSGTHLIYPRWDLHPAGRQYWLVDVDGMEDKEILNFGERVKVFTDWHPDGEHIVFMSEATVPPAGGFLRADLQRVNNHAEDSCS